MAIGFTQIECVQPLGVTREASTVSINFSNAINMSAERSIFMSHRLTIHKFKRFIILKKQWEEETLFESSGSAIVSNSAYKEIIGIGKEAIPWIIRDLKKTNNHWFLALEKITGINPIRQENIGKVIEMKNDWIEWATNNNF